jgi:hypothetical protein
MPAIDGEIDRLRPRDTITASTTSLDLPRGRNGSASPRRRTLRLPFNIPERALQRGTN